MTTGGTQVATVSLATSKTWIKDGKKEEKVQWHNLVLWAKQAELIAKYCHKGDELKIRGEIDYRSWDGPDGTKHYRTEIVVAEMEFGAKKGSGGGGAGAPDPEPPAFIPGGGGSNSRSGGGDFGSDDDVPFN